MRKIIITWGFIFIFLNFLFFKTILKISYFYNNYNFLFHYGSEIYIIWNIYPHIYKDNFNNTEPSWYRKCHSSSRHSLWMPWVTLRPFEVDSPTSPDHLEQTVAGIINQPEIIIHQEIITLTNTDQLALNSRIVQGICVTRK